MIQELKQLTREQEQESISEGICANCRGKVVMYCYGEGDSWSVECIKCGYLYDED